MTWMSATKPLTFAWAMEHQAYRAGVEEGKRQQMEDTRRADLDETRRLLYMALYANRTDKGELVATLVNALAHHNLGLDPDEVADELIAALEDGKGTGWIRETIARLTEELAAE